MNDPDQGELRHRLELLAPLFQDLGSRTRETYAKAGIFEALADVAFPVSDAVFNRGAGGYSYHPHGPVYFTIDRAGTLELAGPGGGLALAEALAEYVQLAGQGDLEASGPMEGATEWFPPPRLLLVRETSELYISQGARMRRPEGGTGFVLLGQFLDEKAQLFVEAFRSAG